MASYHYIPISNVVICELEKGLVLMILSLVCITPLLCLKCVYVDIYYLLPTSMFSFILSRLFEVGKVMAKGPFMTPGCCLFCLPSLCAQPNLLTMIDKYQYCVEIFEVVRFKNICLIF